MPRFGLIVEFDVVEERVDDFKQAIEENAQASVAAEPDCIQFDVLHIKNQPGAFRLYEVYTDEAAFEHHRKLAHTQAFLERVKPWVRRQSAHRLTRLANFQKG